MSRILDKSFRYTPASKTTPERLVRVFAAERRRLAELAEAQRLAETEVVTKVRPLKKEATR